MLSFLAFFALLTQVKYNNLKIMYNFAAERVE